MFRFFKIPSKTLVLKLTIKMKDQQRTSIRCSPIYLENENLPTHVRLKTIFRDDLIEEYNDWRNLTNSQKTESIKI